MELRPGMGFILDGKSHSYVGIRSDSKESEPQIVTAIDDEQAGGALHTIVSMNDIVERGTDFWIVGKEYPYTEFARQYDEQRMVLERAGFLQPLPLQEGNVGFLVGETEYPLPSIEQIGGKMLEEQERFRPQIQAGYTQLLMIPMGMDLRTLTDRVGKRLVQLDKAGDLLRHPEDPGGFAYESFFLHEESPIRFIDLQRSFELGDILYDPKEFTPAHGAKTKTQLLETLESRGFPGWRILLVSPKELNTPLHLNPSDPQLQLPEKLKTFSKIQRGGMYIEDFFIYLLTSAQTTGHIPLPLERNYMWALLGNVIAREDNRMGVTSGKRFEWFPGIRLLDDAFSVFALRLNQIEFGRFAPTAVQI